MFVIHNLDCEEDENDSESKKIGTETVRIISNRNRRQPTHAQPNTKLNRRSGERQPLLLTMDRGSSSTTPPTTPPAAIQRQRSTTSSTTDDDLRHGW
jgi:hypothetical protein